jgi:hypothetical protein
MPIPDTSLNPTLDGFVSRSAEATWNDARESTTGDAVYASLTASSVAIRASLTGPGRGAGYYVSRCFFRFDTSGINFLPKSALFRVRGHVTSTITAIACVKANFGASLTTADFDAIEGWDHGRNNSGNVTYYASNSSAWSTSGLNSFTLNSTALSDIAGMDNLEICLLDVSADLAHTGGSVPPSSTNYSGVVFVDHGTSSYRPNLRITHQDDAISLGANF